MALITVDKERCIKDGACVAECPVGIIRREEGGVPFVREKAEAFCIDCDHCVAVCPRGALSHKNLSPGQCLPAENLLQGANQVESFLRSRRSIRSYKGEKVPRKELGRLINIARYAPTGHNSQPVQYLVVYNPEDVRRLAGMVIDWMKHALKNSKGVARATNLPLAVAGWRTGKDTICRGAPHLIVTYAHKFAPTATVSCATAIAYLELAAPALGLGSCWAGYFHAAAGSWQPLQEALQLPEGHICGGAAMVGYPQYRYHRLPERKPPQIRWL